MAHSRRFLAAAAAKPAKVPDTYRFCECDKQSLRFGIGVAIYIVKQDRKN
jgi:hypothetical protein